MPDYAPCPNCSSTEATQVGFTWWGGVLGPRMLTHVKCRGCGTRYNGKTGGSNTGGIIIYTVVVGVIFIGLAILLTQMN